MPNTAAVAQQVDTLTLRAWWASGAWHRLTPLLRDVACRCATSFRLAPDDVDDLVSAAIVRCWTALVIPDDPLRFMATVMHNVTRDHLKSHRVKFRAEGDVIDEQPDDEPSALEAIVRAENLLRLRIALSELPDLLRRPLALHDLHGQTCGAIAVKLGLAEGAVKMRVHRARKALGAIYVRTLPLENGAPGHASTAREALPRDPTTAPRAFPPLSLLDTPSAPVARTEPPSALVAGAQPTRRGRKRVHRCRCGDPACREYSSAPVDLVPSPRPALPPTASLAPSVADARVQLMGGAP